MGIKKHLFLSVFSVFFALFGGVGVAHAADYLPGCEKPTSISDLDETFTTICKSGMKSFTKNGMDWTAYFNPNRELHGTAFCSATETGSAPASSSGRYCWCGIESYTDGTTTFNSNPTAWAFVQGHSSQSDCEQSCFKKCEEAIEKAPCDFVNGVGMCYTPGGELPEWCNKEQFVPILEFDYDFCNVELDTSTSETDGTNWEAHFTGGQTLSGTSFCSATDAGTYPSSSSGQYCWCGIESYNDGSTTFSSGLVAWQYTGYNYFTSQSDCQTNCSSKCINFVGFDKCRTPICDSGEPTTYQVHYSCKAGTTSFTDPNTYSSGASVTTSDGKQCDPPTGYVFGDWSCDNGVGLVSGDATFTMPAGDVTCIAEWTPTIYTIRLYNYNNTSTHGTIYEWHNTGWYSDSAATTTIFSAPVPTRSGYRFRGFYTATQSDLTASGGSGTRVITQNGGLPANNTYTANTDLYAAWALNCSAGTGCNCTLNINSNGTVTYATSAQSGYTLTSGSGTYAPVCSAIDYTVSFVHGNGGASGSMSSQTNKHIGDTITLPSSTFTAPSGYSFSGWSCDNGIGNKAANEQFTMPAANVTCTAQWAQQITYPFTLTTTSLSANSTFQFTMSAQGTFYVDCGDGGILSGPSGSGVSGNTITKSDTTSYTYTCTYSSAGAKTIQFGGAATRYSASTSVSVIRFTSPTLVDAISGNLSQIFPETVSAGSSIPRFISTFEGCSNLVSIPDTLFSQYTKTGQYMFWYTFKDCTGLGTSNNPGVVPITAGLFSEITGFYTSVPQAGFYYTFQGCTGLTSIPKDLFLGIRNSASVARVTFSGTFQGCTGLTSIPEELFSGITTAAQSSFASTFQGCTGLTSIPKELFSSITTVAQSSFASTFQDCTGLTSIPSELFGNVSGAPATNMFASTFQNCSNITGFGDKTYVPGDFLENITTNTSVSNQTANMFSGTQLNNPCPANTYASTRQQFNGAGKPWCTECPSGATSPAGSTSASQCVVTYNITYYDSDCSTVLTGLTPTTYTDSDAVVLATPTRTGYTFNDGWCSSCGSNCSFHGWQAGMRTGNQSIYMNSNAWAPNIYTIRLRNYNNTSIHSTIYEKYATGWYSNNTATTSINAATVPTRSGYTFRGFYTATQSDLTASGGSGTRVITQTGGLPANNTYTANTDLYAAWARSCNPGAGCTCNLVVNDDGTVTYQTGADTGYTLTSGSGTYAPVCTGNSVSLTWDGGGSPSACTYGGTFVPPTPAPRVGYVFTGWRVRQAAQCSLNGLDPSIGTSWNATYARWKPISSTGYTMASEFGTENSSDLNNGEWAVTFSYGTVKGIAKCSETNGSFATPGTPSDTDGRYCWCSATNYTPNGGNQCNIASPSWVFGNGYGDADYCANFCAYNCAHNVQNYVGFRRAVFGAQ